MTFELLISPVALEETNNAFYYYEEQLPGLGIRFLNSVDEAYQKLSHTPQYFSFINAKKDLRDFTIKDFAFVIIFQIIKNKVLVLRVFNTNRDTRLIKII